MSKQLSKEEILSTIPYNIIDHSDDFFIRKSTAYDRNDILKAMQEYSDQRLQAFAELLKDEFLFMGNMTEGQVKSIIDTALSQFKSGGKDETNG